MNSLIDFLFSNMIPVIIVGSIIVRIYLGLKNAARKRESPPAASEQPDLWSRLEPDDDDDEEAPVPPPQKTFARPLLMPAALEGQTFSLSVNPEPLIASSLGAPAGQAGGEAPVHGSLAAVRRERLPREEQQNNSAAAGFFLRLGALPPMKQAVILSEILGPPKGIG